MHGGYATCLLVAIICGHAPNLPLLCVICHVSYVIRGLVRCADWSGRYTSF